MRENVWKECTCSAQCEVASLQRCHVSLHRPCWQMHCSSVFRYAALSYCLHVNTLRSGRWGVLSNAGLAWNTRECSAVGFYFVMCIILQLARAACCSDAALCWLVKVMINDVYLHSTGLFVHVPCNHVCTESFTKIFLNHHPILGQRKNGCSVYNIVGMQWCGEFRSCCSEFVM